MKNIYILGVSGSIGLQALDIINNNKDKFKLIGVSLSKNDTFNHEFLANHDIEIAVLRDDTNLEYYQKKYKNTKFVYGNEGLISLVRYEKCGIVLNALSGSIGLVPTIETIRSGKTLALANKESLVMAGDIVNELLKEHNVKLLPVDSEHGAIFQLLEGEKKESVKKIVITASGGSLRDKNREELKNVTLKDALNHPNWSMGKKITIDSATMANKCLEIIEAHHLFNIPYEQIKTVIHKESIIHGLIYFKDNSVKASLGLPDMRLPISYALSYPDRLNNDYRELKLNDLSFEPMDFNRFPLVKKIYEVGKQGGLAPVVFNAANEAAVNLFLENRIAFLEIENIILNELKSFKNIEKPTITEILETNDLVMSKVYAHYGKKD